MNKEEWLKPHKNDHFQSLNEQEGYSIDI